MCVYYTRLGAIHTHPDVTFAGEESLRDARGVKAGSSDVQGSHEEEPAHLSYSGGPEEALWDYEVQRGDNSTQAQAHKHTCHTHTVY